MDEHTREILRGVAHTQETPCYVYLSERVVHTIEALRRALRNRFTISYAIKCNPNVALLREMRTAMSHVDASSIGEVDRALAAGYTADNITFSGPAKRDFEIERAVALGIGAIVCESQRQLEQVNAEAARQGRRADVLLRINPQRVPRKFGLSMAGRTSQFGVDEEDVAAVLAHLEGWHHLDFCGFHIYSGGSCLDADAIAENFGIFVDLFVEHCEAADLTPRKLIFGSGFGIPYFDGDVPLDLNELAPQIEAALAPLEQRQRFAGTEFILEMGRYLTGPHGYLLTRVVAEKHSRGAEIRLCDAGFNNHLSACGMMGTVIRRNWKIENLRGEDRDTDSYLLVGPLCAGFDQLAAQLELPLTEVGDCLAVEASGAYGLSASPTAFISHPVPREYLAWEDGQRAPRDISEPLSRSPSRDPAGQLDDAAAP